MIARRLEFVLLEGRYALTRLPPTSPHPAWADGQFVAVIRSAEGMTVVCDESAVPAGLTTRKGLRCLEIAGAFELTSVGIVATATQPLAAAGVSLFAYSTWQTDYILIHAGDLERATAALRAAGHALR